MKGKFKTRKEQVYDCNSAEEAFAKSVEEAVDNINRASGYGVNVKIVFIKEQK